MERLDKIGVDTTSETSGGGLRGGEPEDSALVTRKNSSVEPALFFFKVTTKVKRVYQCLSIFINKLKYREFKR